MQLLEVGNPVLLQFLDPFAIALQRLSDRSDFLLQFSKAFLVQRLKPPMRRIEKFRLRARQQLLADFVELRLQLLFRCNQAGQFAGRLFFPICKTCGESLFTLVQFAAKRGQGVFGSAPPLHLVLVSGSKAIEILTEQACSLFPFGDLATQSGERPAHLTSLGFAFLQPSFQIVGSPGPNARIFEIDHCAAELLVQIARFGIARGMTIAPVGHRAGSEVPAEAAAKNQSEENEQGRGQCHGRNIAGTPRGASRLCGKSGTSLPVTR